MIKRKALRKIFLTTLTVFILLVVYLIPTTEEEKSLETNLEVEYLTGLGTHTIYLLNSNDYLVRTNILLYEEEVVEQVREILDTLIIGNNSTNPLGLSSYIDKDVIVNDILYEDGVIKIDFSKEFASSYNIEKVIEGIVFSMLSLDDVEGVLITVEGESLTLLYPNIVKENVLTKDFGINKKYDITTLSNVSKTVINYVESIDNNNYYVPVTKYSNDIRDKIIVIIDSLTSSYIYEPNLMSYLNANTELIDYNLEEDRVILNLSDHVLTDDDYILEEVTYSLGYSILDNFEVEQVDLLINGDKWLSFDEENVTSYK